ncbi:hypothetical protein DL93DRAFT_2171178 [Clavulina sp. PMI_390]|nr:hypothetical protein DL93DRAFT_2171178 [Clavulina sp. PMI_390]
MSRTNHMTAFSEDWDNSASWEEVPRSSKTPVQRDVELEATVEDGLLAEAEAETPLHSKHYKQGDTIDWLQEHAMENARKHKNRNLRGAARLSVTLAEAFQIFVIVAVTGVGVGVVGGWLDILIHWLNDLRSGRCVSGITFTELSCCSGLDPGEICTEWRTWSQWFGIRSIAGGSLLQAIAYIILAIAYGAAAAVLVYTYAPYAFHTGIPEIKAILNGYVLDAFLGPWTLLIKGLGLALSVASGLSLGKEGPMVHVSSCLALLAARLFPSFRNNEIRKRLVLSAAAAAGVSVAFGSPLGGVLFGLEELDLFSNDTLIWTAFVTSVIASVSLQYMDPFGTGKLVLFQITASSNAWLAFELMPFLILGAIGGVLGSLFIQANIRIAVYRERSPLRQWPVSEVIVVSAVTAIISFLIPFMKVQTSDLVANLFKDCDPSVQYFGLCNSNTPWSTAFTLIVTAMLKLALTAWTFGVKVPAGVFLPSLAVGASIGRALGILLQGLHRSHPTGYLFTSCPADGDCISPGFYAVIGAAAMLGGVTRMTISIVVILFELTGALSHVLPIMIAVMSSKWVAESMYPEGIYAAWISLHDYPFMPASDYRDKGDRAEDHMTPLSEIKVIDGKSSTLRQLDYLVSQNEVHGFPVTVDGLLLGYATREAIRNAIDPILSNTTVDGRRVDGDITLCTFVPSGSRTHQETIDLSNCLSNNSMRLRQETPLEVVVRMFQSLNLPFVLFTSMGTLTGMMTRRDVTRLFTANIEYRGALVDEELARYRDRL